MKQILLIILCLSLTACKTGHISVLELGDKSISSDDNKK